MLSFDQHCFNASCDCVESMSLAFTACLNLGPALRHAEVGNFHMISSQLATRDLSMIAAETTQGLHEQSLCVFHAERTS